MRSLDDWSERAKSIKIRAEARAEETKNPGQGVDIGYIVVAREIGAVHVSKSDSKCNDKVFEIINGAWTEYEEELCYGVLQGRG